VYVNQIYDHNHVISNWFPYKSDIAAHRWEIVMKWELDFDVTWNKFCHVSHTKTLKTDTTASTLSLRHGRTTKPKRTAKPWRETWGSPCHLYQLRSTWQWAALEVEAQQAACFLQYCCMSNVTEYVSGSPGTTELRKTSNSTANAFVTVTYSDDMESEVLRSFFPSRARRCHFCMGISQKSRDCDRIMD
jgi:hypothetical protein